MAKTKDKGIEIKKGWTSLNLIQAGIRRAARKRISKIKGNYLQKARQGRGLYETRGDSKLVKGLQAKILRGILISVFAKKREYQLSTVLMGSTANSFPLNLFKKSPRATAIRASHGILNNLARVSLTSPLIDSGVASVEAVYLLIRGRVNKRGALNHIINEASESVSSGISVLGTLMILRGLSYIPTPGRIAILIVARIALKKFRNKL
jgi:hypothetical protein